VRLDRRDPFRIGVGDRDVVAVGDQVAGDVTTDVAQSDHPDAHARGYIAVSIAGRGVGGG